MIKYLYTVVGLILFSAATRAGEIIKGYVYDETNQPVIGANVYWEGTQHGTTTNPDGYFEIESVPVTQNLLVSYIGYTPAMTVV